MADSLAPHFTSVYGDKHANTPNLNALAQNGVVFENTYCNSPLCAPSRASMMTGRYVSEIGCYDNANEFPSDCPTIGHVLKGAGYETVIIGKMHFVGYDQLHGFDKRICGHADYTNGYDPMVYRLAYSWEKPPRANPEGGNSMGFSYVMDKQWDYFPQHYDWDNEIHRASLEYLSDKSSSSSPFFCCVSYHAPHNPFWIPEKYKKYFSDRNIPLPYVPDGVNLSHGQMDEWLNKFHYVDKISDRLLKTENLRWLYETFYGMVYELDCKIGELLKCLEKNALAENTIVLFCSDHGDMMGHRGMVQKRYFYERSVKVPLIISDPTGKKGIRIPMPVSLLDILPTLGEISNSAIPSNLPGTSLLRTIEEGVEPLKRTIFAEYHGEGVHSPCFMAIDSDLNKYIYVHNTEERLYNIKDDPEEYTNLISNKNSSSIVSSLKNKILHNFSPEMIAQSVIQSQRNRNFIYETIFNRGV